MSSITDFINTHYRHFNAASLRDAASAYRTHIDEGGRMMVSLAGAMSTAELGVSLAEMIRNNKVAAISCTGANIEEDLFNAIAHNNYKRVPNYRDLTPTDEEELFKNSLNRVTDTCIPETEAMRVVENFLLPHWQEADNSKSAHFPHKYIYKVVLNLDFQKLFQIPLEDSWVLAAAKKGLPLYIPGWEDSTLGNFFLSLKIQKKLNFNIIKTGFDYLEHLADWYRNNSKKHKIGFFQIGGGIAGDFPICVLPLLNNDLKANVPVWSYFCQITDAQESYGGYSGALPNEKISWGKLGVATPKFVIHSDATIVAPLIFTYVLE